MRGFLVRQRDRSARVEFLLGRALHQQLQAAGHGVEHLVLPRDDIGQFVDGLGQVGHLLFEIGDAVAHIHLPLVGVIAGGSPGRDTYPLVPGRKTETHRRKLDPGVTVAEAGYS